jgi:rhamnosyltransferase
VTATEIAATVAILTFNGQDYLHELLTAVETQEFDGNVEILVIDSGSTDTTVDIVSRHETVRLVTIPNSEFSHGRTRNLAAELAGGRYIAYLTQDAVPDGPHWLAELLAPFSLDRRVAVVTGRQRPRARAFPLQKYEINGTFAGLGPATGITVYGADAVPLDGAALGVASFHSDVNAAVDRDVIRHTVPFRDVPYAEDQYLGRDVLEAGLLKAYAGAAVVVHSNDLTLHEYGKRIFDETVGLRRIGFPITTLTRGQQLKLTLRGIAGDTVRILRDREFGFANTVRWLFVNPAYQIRKWSRYRAATHVDLTDEAALRAGSLESHRRASS